MLKRARVIVIDDDPLFRSLVVSLLRQHYYVSVAAEGSEGFYKSLEQPPELAIIDIQMPGWDGLRTLREFRSHPALATVKVMILSGDSTKESVIAAISDGADDYIIKSRFSKTEFLEKLERLLAGKAAPPDAAAENAPPAPASTSAGTGRRLQTGNPVRGPFTGKIDAPGVAGANVMVSVPVTDESVLQEMVDD